MIGTWGDSMRNKLIRRGPGMRQLLKELLVIIAAGDQCTWLDKQLV